MLANAQAGDNIEWSCVSQWTFSGSWRIFNQVLFLSVNVSLGVLFATAYGCHNAFPYELPLCAPYKAVPCITLQQLRSDDKHPGRSGETRLPASTLAVRRRPPGHWGRHDERVRVLDQREWGWVALLAVSYLHLNVVIEATENAFGASTLRIPLDVLGCFYDLVTKHLFDLSRDCRICSVLNKRRFDFLPLGNNVLTSALLSFVTEKELATMPLDEGIVLPGVTRDSLIELGRSWGEFAVTERIITMRDIILALNEDRVRCSVLMTANASSHSVGVCISLQSYRALRIAERWRISSCCLSLFGHLVSSRAQSIVSHSLIAYAISLIQ